MRIPAVLAFTIEVLKLAAARVFWRRPLSIVTWELASEFNLDEKHVREILVNMHNERLIKLGSCVRHIHDIVPYDQLGMTVDKFFDSTELGRYREIEILARGDEVVRLENRPQIGFV